MCYVVAKNRYAHGCYTYETQRGQHLVELERALNDAVGLKGVEIMTISRPEAYIEYAPYQIIEDEQEFIRLVKAMRDASAAQRNTGRKGKKCEAMDRISARRDEEAVIEDRYETAKLLWDNGEHDYEKISKIARLTLEQVREALSVQSV